MKSHSQLQDEYEQEHGRTQEEINQSYEDSEEHVKTLENNIKDDWNAGTIGSRKDIVKGKCPECGCNRLIRYISEPEGAMAKDCPACNTQVENNRR